MRFALRGSRNQAQKKEAIASKVIEAKASILYPFLPCAATPLFSRHSIKKRQLIAQLSLCLDIAALLFFQRILALQNIYGFLVLIQPRLISARWFVIQSARITVVLQIGPLDLRLGGKGL